MTSSVNRKRIRNCTCGWLFIHELNDVMFMNIHAEIIVIRYICSMQQSVAVVDGRHSQAVYEAHTYIWLLNNVKCNEFSLSEVTMWLAQCSVASQSSLYNLAQASRLINIDDACIDDTSWKRISAFAEHAECTLKDKKAAKLVNITDSVLLKGTLT